MMAEHALISLLNNMVVNCGTVEAFEWLGNLVNVQWGLSQNLREK